MNSVLAAADHITDWLLAYGPTYRQAINEYTDWLDTDPLTADRATIQRYIRHLTNQGYADATIRKKASAVSSFYSYLVQEKVLTHNPADNTKRPQGESAPRFGLTEDEFLRLLNAARDHSSTAHALVSLQTGAGLRVSEACSALIEDLDNDRSQLTTTVKRGHRRIKPLSPPVLAAVLTKIGDRTTGRILTNRDGQPLSRQRGWELIKKLAGQAGITRDVTDHELRNTCAELMLERGARIEDVSAVLGHKNLETTLRYVRSRDELAGMTSAVNLLTPLLTAPPDEQ